jgi:hypothetical protein
MCVLFAFQFARYDVLTAASVVFQELLQPPAQHLPRSLSLGASDRGVYLTIRPHLEIEFVNACS